MPTILLTLLLVVQHARAVVNGPSTYDGTDDPKQNQIPADDRISHQPFDDYGPPNFNGPPAPIYGPPELTGNSDTRIYPPPPPELPPLPFPSRHPKPVYGVPKQFYPAPPRLKFIRPPPKFVHPKPIPIPITNYNPPTPETFPDVYGSPLGIPAPPTPPDIKYDGWQPISGTAHEHADLPSDSYGVPILSKEAQNLKESIANENEGLPPPPLPHYESLYNQSPPRLESHRNFAPPREYGIPPPPRGNPFAVFTPSYLRHGVHHSRHGPFGQGPPLPPIETMIPPKNREPLRFDPSSLGGQALPDSQYGAPWYGTPRPGNDCEPIDNSYLPPLGAERLDLDSHEQSKIDLKDSYGNPIGGASTNALDEGTNRMESLEAEGSDHGFQIQGSKGSYALQIQAAVGENSDGSVRHEQLLSDGLLREILAAIEQPESRRSEERMALYFDNTNDRSNSKEEPSGGNLKTESA